MASVSSVAPSLTASDIDSIRADTPGTADSAYFMSAGAALVPRPVDSAIREHLDLELRLGGYAA